MKLFIISLALILFARAALAADAGVPIPSFRDPAEPPRTPSMAGMRAIRFLTDDDFPPLNYALPDGALAGFNVDIARAICEELKVGCTIQARRWDTLLPSLVEGKGDAIIASLAPTTALRETIDFSNPYYATPARFVARKGAASGGISAAALAGASVGVIAGSAHKAYVDAFFPGIVETTYPDADALRAALKSGAVALAFVDGLGFAAWINDPASAGCCAFRGGPYTESRFFGEGVGIALRKDDVELRRALDWALARIDERGKYAELYLKHFPIGIY
jgi:polar amino acid transport system substrate-binding protein